MKRLIILFLLLFSTPAFAADGDTWCRWDGNTSTVCGTERTVNQSSVVSFDRRLYILDVNKFNAAQVYKLGETYPTWNPSLETLDGFTEILNGTEIQRTWLKRDLTQEEINISNCQLSEFDQWLLKFFVTQGTYQASDFPAAIQQAYSACQAINP